jgi:kynurenine 3-monooxygenase
LYFQKRCTGFDASTGRVRLRDEQTGQSEVVEPEIVIACDGSGSAVRTAMLKLNRFNFSQQYLNYGYKELTIPAGPDGRHVIETNALHIWPRGNFMLIALPNIDGTFACILFLPFEGENSFETLRGAAEVTEFFARYFPDAISLMPKLVENYFANPVGSMVTIKCSPWHVGGKALLLGDSAHAIVPFFGQGINCGFEDCTALMELLDQHEPDWQGLFIEFEQARKINTDAIADMAIENFVEMRDRVADARFLLKKKAELALESRYPGIFVPKYAMVSFHRVPYSVALARGTIQDEMLAELCDPINTLQELDWCRADELVRQKLTPLEHAA